MNVFTPAETVTNYLSACPAKAGRSVGKTFVLAILAGMFIALGAALANTATHAIDNAGLARLLNGLLFPVGLVMVVLLGAELFTGNCMLPIGVAHRSMSLARMLRNWVLVYLGNFAGALLVAAGCAFTGQLNYSLGGLAVYSIKIAAAKCALPFSSALVMGIFCNVLVCAGVLCSLTAKDTPGKVLGAYIPVAVFVGIGFEHSIANMFYIPVGFFAMMNPEYAALAQSAGIDTASLTLGNFLGGNLLPVTIGNIIGGMALAFALYYGLSIKKAASNG